MVRPVLSVVLIVVRVVPLLFTRVSTEVEGCVERVEEYVLVPVVELFVLVEPVVVVAELFVLVLVVPVVAVVVVEAGFSSFLG